MGPRRRRLPEDCGVNVLIVVPWDQAYGGVACVTGQLAGHLRRHGHDVVVLNPGEPERRTRKRTRWGFEGYELNLRAPYVPGRPFRSVAAFLAFLPFTLYQLGRILLDHRIHVVNVHYPLDSFVYFAILRRLLGVRLVVSIHGDDILPEGLRPRRHSPALHVLLRAADLIVAPSRRFLEDAMACFPRLAIPGVAIHNGIDVDEWLAPSAAPASTFVARLTPTAGHGAPFLLCVAAHYERKGIDVLLHSFALLRSEFPSHRLVLVGTGPKTPELQALAHALEVEDQVDFLGDRSPPEVRALLRACDAFVLPTRYESFGVALVEAMASGATVVACAAGGVPEVVDDGLTGLLVPPDDAAALAASIRRCLADPWLRERLRRAAIHSVRARFNATRTGERYVEELSRLVESFSHARTPVSQPTSS